jgi:hypothetical protein
MLKQKSQPSFVSLTTIRIICARVCEDLAAGEGNLKISGLVVFVLRCRERHRFIMEKYLCCICRDDNFGSLCSNRDNY